jgi:tripartite-type tricarboxylate transporter receptor subunit TctC
MFAISRRAALRQGLCLPILGAWGLPALAQPAAFPSKPIVVKVAFPTGGPADASIRAANVVLQRNLGQPLLADNLPGANGSIAAMNVLNAAADGYTLLGTTGTDFMVAPLTIASARYQPDSFRLVGISGWSDFALVSSPAHHFRNIDDLIAYAKNPANPQLSIGHWGNGSAPHIVGADFQARTGVKFLEVPYKGAAPAMVDVAGGQVDLTFIPFSGPTVGMAQSGKLNLIGVASSSRHPLMPQLPTIGESRSAPGFEYSQWAGVLAPPKTPDAVVARLTAAMNEWVGSPENAARIATSFQRKLDPMSPAQCAALLKAETEKFTRVARALKLEPQ